MSKEDRVNEVIDLLRQGWVQGQLCAQIYDIETDSYRYAYCAEGVIRKTRSTVAPLTDDWLWCAATKKCEEMHGLNLVVFNDRQGRTVDAVIAVFEKVRADLIE